MNDQLFDAYARTRDPELLARLVELHLPLSRAIAARFTGRGVELEDLEQVAAMALMKAVERFEPERGLQFSTFAMPTIAGSLRNHVRDHGRVIRLSRNVDESLRKLARAQERLTQRLGREPSMKELAAELAVSWDGLLELLDARESANVASLDAPVSEEDARALEARLGAAEAGYERAEQRDWWNWVTAQLTPQERKLLELRYVRRLGQRETAAELGVSQMQVSRLERRMLGRLRERTEPWRPAP